MSTFPKGKSASYYQKALEAISRVEKLILTVSNRQHLLRTILEEAIDIGEAESGSLFLYDPEGNDLYFAIALGTKASSLLNMRVPIGKGIVGSCLQERTSIIVNDAQKDPRFYKNIDQQTKYTTKNLISIPLFDQDDYLGAIQILNKKGGKDFTSDDASILELLGHHAAITLKLANLIEDNIQFERKAAVADAMSGISHYIKNILTGLLSSKAIVSSYVKEENDQVLHRCWKILEKNITLISDLVQDMLTYSKSRKQEKVKGNINEVLRDVCELYNVSFQNASLQLIQDLDDKLPYSYFDAISLKRCFLNIIGNSLDALKEKGSSLTVRTATDSDDTILVEFIDDGPGIPEGIADKIFTPFFSTKKKKGTGLGLPITKKIIQENGGEIKVSSHKDEGTTFSIVLPST